MITVVVKAKAGMEDVYNFLQEKKARLESEVRQEVAEREEVIDNAISAITYTEEVEVADEEEQTCEEQNY